MGKFLFSLKQETQCKMTCKMFSQGTTVFSGDGGKWICNPHRITQVSNKDKRKCLICSVVSRGDFNFEICLRKVLTGDENKWSCEIHLRS
jgi:hypothetical protein